MRKWEILEILIVKSWSLLCREEEEIFVLLEAEPGRDGSEQNLDSWPGPCFPSLNESSSSAPAVICRFVIGLETQVIMVVVVPSSAFMVCHPPFCLQLGYTLDLLGLISITYSFAVLQLHLPIASTACLVAVFLFCFP